MNPKVDIKKIIDFRQKLHKFPRLSGYEADVVALLDHFFQRYNPDKVYKLFDNAIAFQFGPSMAENTFVFRSETDALPIDESKSSLPYASTVKGVAHKCGHDGHMAIMTGLAEAISKLKNNNDRIIFLFQPAEENLQGALQILSTQFFKQLENPIFIAVHNIPGYEKGSIILKEGEVTKHVIGLKIYFTGSPQHAALSETKSNVLQALESIMKLAYDNIDSELGAGTKLSITYIELGQPNFGTEPDKGVIFLTLRANTTDALDNLIDFTEDKIRALTQNSELKFDLEYLEDAPAVFNDPLLVSVAKQTAKRNNIKVIEIDQPFAWGEDFGFYTVRHKGVFIGLGAGTDTPQLHTYNYDFPDEILMPAIEYLFNFYLDLSQNLKNLTNNEK